MGQLLGVSMVSPYGGGLTMVDLGAGRTAAALGVM